jgi:outer membrane protein
MQRLVLVSLAAVAVLATAPTALRSQGSQAAPAPAPVPGPVKIAFISSQEILQKTPGYAVAESTYRKELQASQTEYQKLQQQLDSAVQVFDQQSIALSPAARSAKQKDLQAMQQRVEQRSTELQDRLRQREQELLGPLRARINSVIQGIRAEMNYSVIFDADAAGGFIAAADPALNITPRVLQRLAQAQ